MKQKNNKKSKNPERTKKIATFAVVGVLLFSMIFSCFSYLIYAIQSV